MLPGLKTAFARHRAQTALSLEENIYFLNVGMTLFFLVWSKEILCETLT